MSSNAKHMLLISQGGCGLQTLTLLGITCSK